MPQNHHVYMIFSGRLRVPVAFPGEERLEIGFFSRSTLPWDKLAFPTDSQALNLFFDAEENAQSLHIGEFSWSDDAIQFQSHAL